MKSVVVLLSVLLSSASFAAAEDVPCAKEASHAANAALRAELKMSPVASGGDGAWIVNSKTSGQKITFLIETSVDDTSCRDCYFAGYYYVDAKVSKTNTCEILAVRPNR